MKKSKNKLTKSRALMMLSTMSALTKKYERVNMSCVLALSGMKQSSSKIELTSASKKTLKFFYSLKELGEEDNGIDGNERTILSFCSKMSDELIGNSIGSNRVKSFESIKEEIAQQMKSIDENLVDDSQRLMKQLG